jgi:hypothetical protein
VVPVPIHILEILWEDKNTMLESKIERRLCTGVKKLGGLCMKWTSPDKVGVPDRIVFMPKGIVYFVELKTERGVLSPTQRLCMDKLRGMGCNTRVLYGTTGVAGVDGFLYELRVLFGTEKGGGANDL